MENTVNQRLKILKNLLGIRLDKDFAQILGMKQGSFSDVMRGRIGVSRHIIGKLELLYNVNPKWLETGEGDIFTKSIAEKSLDTDPAIINEPKSSGYKFEDIPIYDIELKPGFEHSMLTKSRIIGYTTMPHILGSNFLLKGRLLDANYIGLRKVNPQGIIDYGNYYGIVTPDIATIKRVKKGKSGENMILLVSDQDESESYEINRNEIRELYLVTGAIKTISL